MRMDENIRPEWMAQLKGSKSGRAALAELEAKDNRIAELEADRLCRCVDEVRCELQAQINRLSVSGTKDQIEIDELEAENERLTAMSDLIERLRGENKGGDIGHEAADRIEELEDEVERLTAVYEAAKDHVEWCRLNRGRGFSRLEQALAAEGVPEDMCCKDWPNCKEG